MNTSGNVFAGSLRLTSSASLNLNGFAASIAELRSKLLSRPDDTDIKYELARTLSFSGDNEQAISLYKELLSKYPDNPDYLLGIGQAYLWDEKTTEAIPYLEQAHAIAPDYNDVTQALKQARAKTIEEKKIVSAANKHSPIYEDKGLHLKIENRVENLNYNPDNWRDSRFTLTQVYGERSSASAYYHQSDRFDQNDNTFGIMGYHPLSENLTAYADFSYSPTHRVLPEYSAYGQLGLSLSNGWGTLAGFRVRDYTDSTVYTVDLTLEKYISDFRYAYTGYVSHSEAGTALSHRIQFGYFFSDKASIQIALSKGKELEKSANANNVIETKFTDMSLWGEYWLIENLIIKYGIGFTDLELPNQRSGNRKSLNIGFDYHF